MAKIIVIGAGFSGLSAAAYLSREGHQVEVFEKNSSPGGRARQLKTDSGYVFDMGPSWYWMPEVFERFFGDFGYKATDLYDLKLLDPSFEIIFDNKEKLSIPEDYSELKLLFESIEQGSSSRLEAFMAEAKYKYETGMENLVYMPGLSLSEFADADLLKGIFRLQVFRSFSKHVRKYFSHPKLIALMEFPVLFLGAMPQDTPALYSLMNYAGLRLGTWYPKGGFGKVVRSIVEIAEKNGVRFHYNSSVEEIPVSGGRAAGVVVNGKTIEADAVVAAADYHFVEEKLLPPSFRNYKPSYWEKRVLAPSCLIFFVGLKKKLQGIEHHSLFFEESFHQHSLDIYKNPQWPEKPLFYVCCPSKSDDSVAPPGHENLFFLMPLAPGLDDTESLREAYFRIMLHRLEKQIGQTLTSHIDFKQSYCINDFMDDYNSFKGNAYGLANTLMQTANLKPSIKNRKIANLYYAGQLTVPGPGVPPSLISGKIVATELLKHLKSPHYEKIV